MFRMKKGSVPSGNITFASICSSVSFAGTFDHYQMLIYGRVWIIYDVNKLIRQFVDKCSMPPYEVSAYPQCLNKKKNLLYFKLASECIVWNNTICTRQGIVCICVLNRHNSFRIFLFIFFGKM